MPTGFITSSWPETSQERDTMMARASGYKEDTAQQMWVVASHLEQEGAELQPSAPRTPRHFAPPPADDVCQLSPTRNHESVDIHGGQILCSKKDGQVKK